MEWSDPDGNGQSSRIFRLILTGEVYHQMVRKALSNELPSDFPSKGVPRPVSSKCQIMPLFASKNGVDCSRNPQKHMASHDLKPGLGSKQTTDFCIAAKTHVCVVKMYPTAAGMLHWLFHIVFLSTSCLESTLQP